MIFGNNQTSRASRAIPSYGKQVGGFIFTTASVSALIPVVVSRLRIVEFP